MAAPLNVVIADDSPDDLSEMVRVLAMTPVRVAGVAFNADTLMHLAMQHRPQVVLIDAHLPGPPIGAIIQDLAKLGAAVVVLMERGAANAAMVQHLAAAGARDVLYKPLTSQEVTSRLLQPPQVQVPVAGVAGFGGAAVGGGSPSPMAAVQPVIQEAPPPVQENGRPAVTIRQNVLLFVSGPGGRGKSSLAKELAAAFAQNGVVRQRVLLCDFDLAASAISAYLQAPALKTFFSLMEFRGRITPELLRHAVLPYPGGGFDLLLPPHELAETDAYDVDDVKGLMCEIVEVAKQSYDQILIDTGGGVSEIILSLMAKASCVLVMLKPGLADANNLLRLEKFLRDRGFDLSRFRYVLNDVAPGQNGWREEISGVTSIGRLGSLPADPQLAAVNAKGGTPLMASGKGGAYADGVREIAQCFMPVFGRPGRGAVNRLNPVALIRKVAAKRKGGG